MVVEKKRTKTFVFNSNVSDAVVTDDNNDNNNNGSSSNTIEDEVIDTDGNTLDVNQIAIIDQESFNDMFESMFEEMKQKYIQEQREQLEKRKEVPQQQQQKKKLAVFANRVSVSARNHWMKLKRKLSRVEPKASKATLGFRRNPMLDHIGNYSDVPAIAPNTTIDDDDDDEPPPPPDTDDEEVEEDQIIYADDTLDFSHAVVEEDEEIQLSPSLISKLTVDKEKKRGEIIAQLYTTEKEYVESLQIILTEYIIPISQTDPPIISSHTQQTVFKHFDIIVSVNEAFLEELERIVHSPTALDRHDNLGIILNKRATTFKLYIVCDKQCINFYILLIKDIRDILIIFQSHYND
jgi:hypothetical protein